MRKLDLASGIKQIRQFPLIEALLGRRSRRFYMGAQIPDGVFQYKSGYETVPLSEVEKMLVLMACGTNTGWNNLIYRGERYAPHLSNYAGAAGGRTFPSAAGFHTSKTFFTDDEGLYLLDDRDAPAFDAAGEDGLPRLDVILNQMQKHIRKVYDGRLKVPPEVPFCEPHNTWVANHPGTFLVIPVGDMAQQMLLVLCYLLQNGMVVYDDIHKRAITGIEGFSDLVDIEQTWPLSFVEQFILSEMTVELGTSCYAGMLMLQAMGLGGWMFSGLDPFCVLGASGKDEAPGMGFRFDTREDWATPNPTGLEGFMEGYCPPHYLSLREAVEAVCDRKFGPGGPYHRDTGGPWQDTRKVRSSAQVHDPRFRQCVALQAQYLYDTFGKFPATVPSMYTIMYLQAQHIDTDFYDTFYNHGAYLKTHAEHFKKWHRE